MKAAVTILDFCIISYVKVVKFSPVNLVNEYLRFYESKIAAKKILQSSDAYYRFIKTKSSAILTEAEAHTAYQVRCEPRHAAERRQRDQPNDQPNQSTSQLSSSSMHLPRQQPLPLPLPQTISLQLALNIATAKVHDPPSQHRSQLERPQQLLNPSLPSWWPA